MAKTTKSFLALLRGGNLGVPLVILCILAMVILPLPPALLDILFTFNIVLAVMVLAALLCWKQFAPQAVEGGKTITVEVVHGDGSEKTFTISTDSENLRGALEQEEGLIVGDESEYGLFVTTVDGETADSANEEWWCFTKGGEALMTGVDDTMIADGEQYEITLTVGYGF